MVFIIDLGLLGLIVLVLFLSGASAVRQLMPYIRIGTWGGILLSIVFLTIATIRNEVLTVPQKVGCIIANIAGNLIIGKLVMDVVNEVSSTDGGILGTLLAGAETIFGGIIIAFVSAILMFCGALLMGHDDDKASVPFWGKFAGVMVAYVIVCIIFR